MVARISPNIAEPNPFRSWSPDTPAIMVKENKISVYTSGEPKARAKLANIPANKIRDIFEKKSAMHEEYKAMSNALLASPLLARG